MKVIRHTDEQLILRSVPWVMSILLCAAFVGVIGFGLSGFFTGNQTDAFWGLLALPAFLSIFLVAFIRRDEVILDRSRNLLELRHSTFLGRTRVRHELHNLERALVQTSNSDDGGRTHRAALILHGGMDAGTHPVTPVYVSGDGAKRAVDIINAWLAAE